MSKHDNCKTKAVRDWNLVLSALQGHPNEAALTEAASIAFRFTRDAVDRRLQKPDLVCPYCDDPPAGA
jgi:hypothetical protein